eukprot:TRINITY_DN1603_c0_g4_i3.p1 TRINITY_DN1603_c0_g4~~TRINITY_DN1603_c0_g4_i3.p1  ORF type:complete len:649 (+),score=82.00 TRINITY_DN1603_c0_g4_i3:28-1947(+)
MKTEESSSSSSSTNDEQRRASTNTDDGGGGHKWKHILFRRKRFFSSTADDEEPCGQDNRSAIDDDAVRSQQSETATTTTTEHKLHKTLSLFDLVAFGIGAIIGAGIFVLTGVAAAQIAGPSIILSFLFDGVACSFTALCYSELASRTPLTGSAYAYTYVWIGEFPAFLVGWGLCLEYGFAVAAVARGLSGYFWLLLAETGITEKEVMIEWTISRSITLRLDIVACLLSVAVMLYLIFFATKSSSTTNAIITIVSVVVIFFVIIAGAFYVNISNLSPFAPYGVQGVFQGAAFVFFSFLGFDSIATLSEEVENSQRNVPLAIIISLLFCSVLYALVSFVITGMVPYQLIDIEAPLAAAFDSKGISWAGILITIGAFAALITTMLTSQMAMTRLLFAKSRDGLLPTSFSHIKNGIPFAANILSGSIASLLALCLDIALLSGLVCAGTLAAFVVVCFSVLYIRIGEGLDSGTSPRTKREIIGVMLVMVVGVSVTNTAFVYFELYWPSLFLMVLFIVGPFILICKFFFENVDSSSSSSISALPPLRRSSFRCPFVPVLPLLGIIVNVFMFANLSTTTLIWFSVWLGLGIVVYFLYGMNHSKVANDVIPLSATSGESFVIFSSFTTPPTSPSLPSSPQRLFSSSS